MFLRGFHGGNPHTKRGDKPLLTLSKSQTKWATPPTSLFQTSVQISIHFNVPPIPETPQPVKSNLTANPLSVGSSLWFGSRVGRWDAREQLGEPCFGRDQFYIFWPKKCSFPNDADKVSCLLEWFPVLCCWYLGAARFQRQSTMRVMIMMSSHHQQHYTATMETAYLKQKHLPVDHSPQLRGNHTLFTLHRGPFGRGVKSERNQQNQRRFTEAGVTFSILFVDHCQVWQGG